MQRIKENPWVRAVAEFQEKFEKKFDTSTENGKAQLVFHRMRLIHEEQLDLLDAAKDMVLALSEKDEDAYINAKVDALDAIADEIYVLIGMANVLGMDLTGAFDEVQRSNMSKLGADGKPIFNEVGKTMKGPNYTPPNLRPYVG